MTKYTEWEVVKGLGQENDMFMFCGKRRSKLLPLIDQALQLYELWDILEERQKRAR